MSRYLYEDIEVLDRIDQLEPIPDFITENLAPHIKLREYQEKAIRYFITYYEKPKLRKNRQLETMFRMATGSGKTVIMAALSLYLYSKGFRNFIFFVDSTNIIEKTKENFLNPSSNKYLFNTPINFLGNQVDIVEVKNFSRVNPDNMNIILISTHGLHNQLKTPKENALTYEDFENEKVAFLSDESHHLNALTKKAKNKKLNSTEQESENSWEYSVMTSVASNTDNVLLEFTATLDLKNEAIAKKYKKKLVYDYSLVKFRESGYTKDFQNYATTTDLWTRSLIACIVSEYRRYMFSDINLNIKPVILLKANIINTNKAGTKTGIKEHYKDFYQKLDQLSTSELEALEIRELETEGEHITTTNAHPLQEALSYFKKLGEGSYSLLEQSIKSSFSEDKSIILYQNNITKEKQLALNSLEDKDNPYRIIFAVDMLNEGWDVLNLFDIVRLYETRDSGNYTMSEAQLIGRGARYQPFKETADQEKYKRKYDSDLTNPLRYLETMFFHSQNDSKYISELRQALKETGMVEDDPIELQYKLKPEVFSSDLYNRGIIYTNRRVKKDRQSVGSVPERKRNEVTHYTSSIQGGSIYNLFDEDFKVVKSSKERVKITFKEIPYNILVGASERFKTLRFNIIQEKYPNVKSLKDFLTSEDYLGNRAIVIHYQEDYSTKDIYNALVKAMAEIASDITQIKPEYEGTKEFKPDSFSNVIKDKTIRLSSIREDGLGESQVNHPKDEYRLSLDQEEWYIFNDNYGTTEEKSFLNYFKDEIKPLLDSKNLEYYVVRNERFIHIYSFDDGERFEPDFILYIRKEKTDKFEVSQVFAEPKGSHLLERDSWKETFLKQIESLAEVDDKFNFEYDYDLIGLPFFNREERMEEFGQAVKEWIEEI